MIATEPRHIALLALVLAVVVLPGLLVAIPASIATARYNRGKPHRVPTSPVLAGAPATTFGFWGAMTTLADVWGLRWSLPTAIVGFIGIAAFMFIPATVIALIRALRSSAPVVPEEPRKWRLSSAAGISGSLVVGLFSSLTILEGFGSSKALVANFDAFFHSSAMRYIAETGQACSSCLGPLMAPEASNYYYPSTYHAVSALAILLHGIDGALPGVYSAMIGATGVIFTVGCAALARACGCNWPGVLAAALVSTSLPHFPAELVSYGQLGPYGMAVAVLPGALAALVVQFRHSSLWALPLAGPALAGVVLLHPSVGLVAVVIAALHGLAVVARAFVPTKLIPGERKRRLSSIVMGLVAAAIAGVFVLTSVDTSVTESMTADWPAQGTWGESWQILILQSLLSPVVGIVILAASTIGLVGLLVKLRTLEITWAVPTVVVTAVALFGAAAARSSDAQWINTWTSLWWNDWRRFAAISVILWAVLSGLGVHATTARLHKYPSRFIALCWLCVLAMVAMVAQPDLAGRAGRYYYNDPQSAPNDAVVTGGEYKAYQWLAQHYKSGLVLNDPYDGSSMLYSLYGIPVVFPVPLQGKPEKNWGRERSDLLAWGHDAGNRDKEYSLPMGHAIEDLDIRWVIVGPTWVGGVKHNPGGFRDLGPSLGFDLVYDRNDVQIYKVDRTQIHATLSDESQGSAGSLNLS